MAGIAEQFARGGPLASIMTRLARTALFTAFALAAVDTLDAAPGRDDSTSTPPGEIRFHGSVLAPTGSNTTADVASVAALPPGRMIRRGSADSQKHGPPRTVVVLPPRKIGARVVLITYE